MNKILILGPQGGGKGTQANILAKKLGIPALSMGHLLRNEIATGSDLGKQIDTIIHGERPLVPDYMALDVLKKRMEKDDAKGGYILDGYPRTVEQLKAFKSYDTPTVLLVINIPHDESIERLRKRAETEGRKDDTPELIARRLELYEEETKPVIAEYEEQGIVKYVDGMGSIEEVAERVKKALDLPK
ncbi:MAG: nucleoside monophosphate kinase [bacterium]